MGSRCSSFLQNQSANTLLNGYGLYFFCLGPGFYIANIFSVQETHFFACEAYFFECGIHFFNSEMHFFTTGIDFSVPVVVSSCPY
jgi:hypothetical protein